VSRRNGIYKGEAGWRAEAAATGAHRRSQDRYDEAVWSERQNV